MYRGRYLFIVVMSVLAIGSLSCAAGELTGGDARDDTLRALDATGGVDTTGGGADTGGSDTAESCTPQAASCTDGTTLKRCNAAGNGYDIEKCSGAERCQGGFCSLPTPVCEANARSCKDLRNITECSSDGLTESEKFCINGRCLEDACSPGAETGETCTQDSQCAGQSCLCLSGTCPGIAEGYCSTKDCNLWGCDREEVCINVAVGQPTPEFRCVKDCTSCAAPFECGPWLGGEGADLAWQDACFYARNLKPVGATCASDDECLGGICFKLSVANTSIDGGYCSSPCTNEASCPGESTCVTLPGFNSDQPFCALSCIDTNGDENPDECPPERPETFFVDCTQERAAGTPTPQLKWVCFQTR